MGFGFIKCYLIKKMNFFLNLINFAEIQSFDMKYSLITALVCLSSLGLFSCTNDTQNSKAESEKPSQVKVNSEVQKQIKIYDEGTLVDIYFAKWVNSELKKNPDLAYSLVGKRNIYGQIAKSCILSGDLSFKELVPQQVYEFVPTEQTKACLMKEIKKPISFKLLGQSFLVPLYGTDDIQLENKLNQIFEQADKKGVFTVEDYLNIESLLQDNLNKKTAEPSPPIKKPA